MLVRIIRPCRGPNPAYNKRQPRDRQTNWPTRDIPVGTEIEDPQAWLLCFERFGQPAQAEPVDDEAKAAVAAAEQAMQERRQRRRRRGRKFLAKIAQAKPTGKPTGKSPAKE